MRSLTHLLCASILAAPATALALPAAPARWIAEVASWSLRPLDLEALDLGASDNDDDFLAGLLAASIELPLAGPDALDLYVTRLLRGELPELMAPSMAVGSPGFGKLVNGVKLASGPGLFVRTGEAWGTREVVEAVEQAVRAVERRHPGAPDLIVTDLSRRRGGWLPPHKSHRNGVDVDTSLYLRDVPRAEVFRRTRAGTVDAARTWALLESVLADDKVEFVLLDYRMQAPLYRYCRRELKMTKAALRGIFSYPNGRYWRRSVKVRHAPHHRNHLHIRFRSPRAVAAALAFDRSRHVERVVHRVARGESLAAIARVFRVAVDELAAWNDLKPTARLRRGMRLWVLRPKAAAVAAL